jgi:ABC-type branched-subunit amino acid transport system substrate-binding protein
VYAYDAFDLLAFALRKAKSVDGRALFNALQGEAVPTTSDIYRFDPSGDYSPAMALGQFDDKGTMMFVEDVQ